MSTKRTRDEPEASSAELPAKKAKHGFRVGPENLPDGPWRRKVDRVKKDLIEKVKVKKKYAKIKAQHQLLTEEQHKSAPPPPPPTTELGAESQGGPDAGGGAATVTATNDADQAQEELEIHPERQAMLDGSGGAGAGAGDDAGAGASASAVPNDAGLGANARPLGPREPRKRGNPRRRPGGGYEKELAEAARKREEAEERAAERARREQERVRRVAERERHRRVMAKARVPGRNGQRRLGRESVVLLDKVKRLVGGPS
ncbi:hypothetical protein QBC33DRAFT_591486 [Phialemonium atrogriseum]|uniref:rRNA-processing protein FYV7 n=1 Tax=Phialemonium atrogriseum TaxID=1093897 RepID=A0AAJ0FQK7_9PEZI|nr:uncharacterized protein QBC33DRAFT_591486 [Phialemonium atrogriseum]KAK1771344.1 hypothetical protein QBC33DRAFT_591486 [Phialemonium atrogriseum]